MSAARNSMNDSNVQNATSVTEDGHCAEMGLGSSPRKGPRRPFPETVAKITSPPPKSGAGDQFFISPAEAGAMTCSTSSQAGDASTISQPTEAKNNKHSWNVNALEFVPRGISTTTNSTSQPSTQVSIPNLSVTAAEFVPRESAKYSTAKTNHNDYSSQVQLPNISSYLQGSEKLAVQKINEAIVNLTTNPGSLEFRMNSLTRDLSEAIQDENSLNAVVDVLFEQCVKEPNFRYTGARMCDYLNTNLKLDLPCQNFRNTLLKRCKDEYSKRDELVKSPESHKRLAGLALAMGELFLGMTIQNADNTKSHMRPLANAVRAMVTLLLNHPTEDNLKTAVQVLKLTGATLEDHERKEGGDRAPELDKIFQIVDTLVKNPNTPSTPASMLLRVLELRSTSWGQNEPACEPPSSTGIPAYFTQVPILFDAMGQQITSEEVEFLEDSGLLYPPYADGTGYQMAYDEQAYPAYSEGQDSVPYSDEELAHWGPLNYYPYDNEGSQDVTYQGGDDGLTGEIMDAYEQYMLESENAQRYPTHYQGPR